MASRFAEHQTSSPKGSVRDSLTLEYRSPIPAPWEKNLVLRTLRIEFWTQRISVYPLPCGGHAALVSANEPGNAAGGSGLQFADRTAITAEAGRRKALT